MEIDAQIKEIIESIVSKMGLVFKEVVITEDESGKKSFTIKTEESGVLIGSRGENISALNHLIKRIIGKKRKEGDPELDFYVDVNDYHEKLLKEIKTKASMLAERARSLKVNVQMDPMTPYERMIIHSFFQDSKDIKTESRGVGKNRAVLLKYVGEDF
jgi:predicted RNA-binding protein Jag